MATSPIYNWPEPDNTDLVKNGALAIRTLGDAIDTTMATMTPKSLVDAKGDLIAASAADTPARLAVGNNGETLVADSSTTTGLRYQGNFAAGKNVLINGDFNIWQRGTSFTTAAGGVYCADRFEYNAAATPTVTRQSFAIGDISGYNPTYYLRFVKGNTTADALSILQKIEDVRTFAGQTVTLSFWAKGSVAFTNEPLTRQMFGTGGSGDVYTGFTTQSITTSWARYSMTFTMPSISGKTIGAGSFTALYAIRYLGTSNITVDTWGWQLELGNTATAFQTATGTIQGELAACQRYYFRTVAGQGGAPFGSGQCASTTLAIATIKFPTTMRTRPTALEQSGTAGDYKLSRANSADENCSAVVTFNNASAETALVTATVAANIVAGNATVLSSTNATAYLGWSAEL